MVSLKPILKAVEDILQNNLHGYTIERNPRRNTDPNKAAKGKGWIGIYRGRLGYETITVGGTPWLCPIEIILELQVASFRSAEEMEDKLEDAENEIMTVLNANKKLDNNVDQTNGYDIDYEINQDVDEGTYYQRALITIHAEVRT